MQSRGNGVRKGGKSALPESAKTIKGDDVGFGSLLYLAKSAPSPRFKMNCYLNYDLHTGVIKHNEDIKETIQILNNMLMGKIENEHLLNSILENEVESEEIKGI